MVDETTRKALNDLATKRARIASELALVLERHRVEAPELQTPAERALEGLLTLRECTSDDRLRALIDKADKEIRSYLDRHYRWH